MLDRLEDAQRGIRTVPGHDDNFNERRNANNPLKAGPFARFLKTLSKLQKDFTAEEAPIRTALVTTRCAPAHERVIRTLRAWNVRIDERAKGPALRGLLALRLSFSSKASSPLDL